MVINPGFSPSSASRLSLRALIFTRALANFDPPTIPRIMTYTSYSIDSWGERW